MADAPWYSPSTWVNALLGPRGSNFPASQPTHYPSQDDADFAQKYDYSYGQTYAPEFTGQEYHFLQGSPNASPLNIKSLPADKVDKTVLPDIKNYYARAALAAQNSGLALLGFDPTKVAADVNRDPDKVNILGTYTPKTDQIYANALSPSTIVHESIHRGIQKLKDTSYWKPEFDEFAGPRHEDTVRWLMQSKMGNPEAEINGDVNKSQMANAKYWFNDAMDAPGRQKRLDAMDRAASQYLADKHPGGPH